MANRAQVNILSRGVTEWNQWRTSNPLVEPDLSNADLEKRDLKDVDFGLTDLRGGILCGAVLRDSIFEGASLCCADLRGADLRGADLVFADLTGARLEGAVLAGVKTFATEFSGAIFSPENGLAGLKNGRKARQRVPLGPALDARPLPNGPAEFLRPMGISESFFERPRSVNGQGNGSEAPAFLRYGAGDGNVVEVLQADLANHGVACAFALGRVSEHDPIRGEIDQSFRGRQGVIALLSQTSLKAAWLQDELERLLELARIANGGKLILIAVDRRVWRDETWAKALRIPLDDVIDLSHDRGTAAYQEGIHELLSRLDSGAWSKVVRLPHWTAANLSERGR